MIQMLCWQCMTPQFTRRGSLRLSLSSIPAFLLGRDSGRWWRSRLRRERHTAPEAGLMGNDIKAFTLVELLVVIVIIAILSALSIPALKRSMEATKSVKCVSNLRTIGLAALQFANDNNGRILTWGDNTFNPSPRWPQGLAPTLGNTGLEAEFTPSLLKKIYDPLACPSIPLAYRFGAGYKVTYAANTFANPGWWPLPEVRMQNFAKPSSTIYMVCGWANFAALPGNDIVDRGWPPPAGWNSQTNAVFFPHQGRCNALFLDGHVESFSKVIPAKFIRP
jgi:prepilin-type processing-associated H-X9-DG protein/prepilin-type N-terminal cleavage/methylation domain-containing protein